MPVFTSDDFTPRTLLITPGSAPTVALSVSQAPPMTDEQLSQSAQIRSREQFLQRSAAPFGRAPEFGFRGEQVVVGEEAAAEQCSNNAGANTAIGS
jgi:hypothetical protein